MEDKPDVLADEEIWQAINDPATADSFARRLFILKQLMESGPDSVREASETLLASIEAAYLHTEAHRAALRLYVLSLTGQLKPQDEPLQLISGAIRRGAARVELAGKGKAGGKKRR